MADIFDTAASNNSLKMLVDAIKTAGFTETLKSYGPFTILAPVDAAFAKLPAGSSKALLIDRKRLERVLNYHILSGRFTSAEIRKLNSVSTVEGSSLSINPEVDTMKINDADVLTTDIVCDNGLIHIIDTVLIPHEQAALHQTA